MPWLSKYYKLFIDDHSLYLDLTQLPKPVTYFMDIQLAKCRNSLFPLFLNVILHEYQSTGKNCPNKIYIRNNK